MRVVLAELCFCSNFVWGHVHAHLFDENLKGFCVLFYNKFKFEKRLTFCAIY